MNTQQKEYKEKDRIRQSDSRGKILGGVIVIAIGVALLLRQIGVNLPQWLFTWEVLVIITGIYLGIKHSLRHPGWIIFILIGSLFLADDIFPDITISAMIWPVLIILLGIIIIFKPRNIHKCQNHQWQRWKHHWKDKYEWENTNTIQGEDSIETVSVFAGVKKHVISKNFKGGEVTCVFGGAEINLMQADLNGTAVLELTQIFGGTKLIVPAHWDIQHHELVAVLGGIEDKRFIQKETIIDTGKKLVLRGTCLLGGIEIKSY